MGSNPISRRQVGYAASYIFPLSPRSSRSVPSRNQHSKQQEQERQYHIYHLSYFNLTVGTALQTILIHQRSTDRQPNTSPHTKVLPTTKSMATAAAIAVKSSLLFGGIAAASLGCAVTANRAAIRLGPSVSNAIADRYLAFDDIARDRKTPVSEAEAAKQRKWRHAMIRQQIRNELQSELM